MNLRSRFAVSFAAVGAVVALLVGVLSYRAAADRVTAEIDRTLRSATVALAGNQEDALALSGAVTSGPDLYPGPDRPGPGDEPPREVTAQSVAPDGTPTYLGGPPVPLPVTDTTRALAASGTRGQSYVTEVVVGHARQRQLTTALGGGRGALQVAVPVDQTHFVLGGMAREIAAASIAVMLAAAGAGWLLARRITRRLVRLAEAAEEVSGDGRGGGGPNGGGGARDGLKSRCGKRDGSSGGGVPDRWRGGRPAGGGRTTRGRTGGGPRSGGEVGGDPLSVGVPVAGGGLLPGGPAVGGPLGGGAADGGSLSGRVTGLRRLSGGPEAGEPVSGGGPCAGARSVAGGRQVAGTVGGSMKSGGFPWRSGGCSTGWPPHGRRRSGWCRMPLMSCGPR
ncbi:HAMP domain-containing protein [Streptomyces galilaeus]